MKRFLVVICLAVVASLYSAPAGATLIGDDVTATLTAYGLTWINAESATVVNPGIEFQTPTNGGGASVPPIFNLVDIDLSASQITITFNFIGGIPLLLFSDHVFTLADLDWVGDPTGVITGLSLVSSNFLSMPTVSNVTDHGFQITVSGSEGYTPDPSGVGFAPLTGTWDILTRHGEIPEPTTMALLGMGAAGLIAKRRRVV